MARFLVLSGAAYGDGGGGQQPAQISRQLVQLGHEVFHYQPRPSRFCLNDGVVEIPCPETMSDEFWAVRARGAREHFAGLAEDLDADGDKWAVVCCPVAWYVRAAEALKAAGWKLAYWIVDDWESLFAIEKYSDYRREEENRLLHLADVVLATAERLRSKANGRDVALVENGFDPYDFPMTTRPRPDGVDRLSVIYWGYLRGDWFDWQLLVGLAMTRPQWRFHLIGPTPPTPPQVQNIMYHGVAPNHWLTRLASIGDVAIIPFKPCPAMDAVDPIKAYEYLACGLPVVACRMPQLLRWPGVTQVANVPALWVSAIEAAARKGVDTGTRDAFLSTRTWRARAEAFLATTGLARCA